MTPMSKKSPDLLAIDMMADVDEEEGEEPSEAPAAEGKGEPPEALFDALESNLMKLRASLGL